MNYKMSPYLFCPPFALMTGQLHLSCMSSTSFCKTWWSCSPAWFDNEKHPLNRVVHINVTMFCRICNVFSSKSEFFIWTFASCKLITNSKTCRNLQVCLDIPDAHALLLSFEWDLGAAGLWGSVCWLNRVQQVFLWLLADPLCFWEVCVCVCV